jgi:hypothetical protein
VVGCVSVEVDYRYESTCLRCFTIEVFLLCFSFCCFLSFKDQTLAVDKNIHGDYLSVEEIIPA